MILLCNDDGFNADGLRTLYRELSKEDEVIIVAPETEQSAMGHAITLTQPLKVRKVEEEGRFMGYAVNGTPADCVKLAIAVLLDEPPRLVVSGINLGGNLGICALYSGTVSAATEAMIMGVPSIAVSLEYDDHADFTRAAQMARQIIEQVLAQKSQEPQLYNLNIPTRAIRNPIGIRVVPMGVARYGEQFVRCKDPKGRTYYWATDEPAPQPGPTPTDLTALTEGFITLTPLDYNLTKPDQLSAMNDWKFELA